MKMTALSPDKNGWSRQTWLNCSLIAAWASQDTLGQWCRWGFFLFFLSLRLRYWHISNTFLFTEKIDVTFLGLYCWDCPDLLWKRKQNPPLFLVCKQLNYHTLKINMIADIRWKSCAIFTMHSFSPLQLAWQWTLLWMHYCGNANKDAWVFNGRAK